MKSPDCPTCGGEFHTVRLRREAMEYALSVFDEGTHKDLCAGCRKVARRADTPSLEGFGNEGVVVEP
jgi:transposase